MKRRDFSILVITHQRTDHLRQVLAGAVRAEERPSEVVIVHMNEEPQYDSECEIPIVRLRIDTLPEGSGLPLARARNVAAATAGSSNLVFLDVDCIPSRGLFTALLNIVEEKDALVMAQPRYLREPLGASDLIEDGILERLSSVHQSRVGLAGTGSRFRHEMFWSLGFAIRSDTFYRIGGFDPGYDGYGAEDTDFAFRAREARIPVHYAAADLFHQWHPIYKPPLNHFETIIANARRFNDRWHRWPMEGWLSAFTQNGLIQWERDSPDIRVLRFPGDEEVEAARSDDPY